MGTWLVPANKVGGFGPVYGASGNDATCSLSGFFTQFAVAIPLYNGTLCWFYLLTIYYNWSNTKIRKVEKWFHIIPLGFACFTSITAVSLNLYGNVEWLCWIKPDIPSGEEASGAQKHFVYFQWLFLFGPIWITSMFVTTVMFLLYRKMRANEKRMQKYRYSIKSLRPDIDLIQRGESYESLKSLGNSGHGGKKRNSAPQGLGDGERWKKLRNSSKDQLKTLGSNLGRSGVCAIAISSTEEVSGVFIDDVEDQAPSAMEGPTPFRRHLAESKDDEEDKGSDEFSGDDFKVTVLEDITEGVVLVIPDPENAEEWAGGAEEKSSDASDGITEDCKQEDILPNYTSGARRLRSNSCASDTTDKSRPSRVSFRDESQSRRPSYARKESFRSSIASGNEDDDDMDTPQKRRHPRWSFESLSYFSRASSTTDAPAGSFNSNSSTREARQKKLYNRALKSRQIAIQGMLYVCAFYVTWLFPTLQRITELSVSKNYFVLQILDTSLLPLQGLFNFIIYIRPRLMSYRKKHPTIGFWRSVRTVAFEVEQQGI